MDTMYYLRQTMSSFFLTFTLNKIPLSLNKSTKEKNMPSTVCFSEFFIKYVLIRHLFKYVVTMYL
jgi:hypothetical protein